jgi:hypothetical protein
MDRTTLGRTSSLRWAIGADGTATGLTVDLEGFTEPIVRLRHLDPG